MKDSCACTGAVILTVVVAWWQVFSCSSSWLLPVQALQAQVLALPERLLPELLCPLAISRLQPCCSGSHSCGFQSASDQCPYLRVNSSHFCPPPLPAPYFLQQPNRL